ncbi:PREDICTED: short-chain type dehydrogenase/reductase [Tarenaya hassleriana]|uniref:short-chain type dehydrogenase/reductase n=1 Tax=Tarenaya hassleriana TaxID=28532 RepID=UPI00053C8D96|nr:PREDICTED: short-chain type dehydrogenase/reductase [Tarenaya hassleriana]
MEKNPTNSSSLPLAGRVAVVTGSSRGIGRAIAVHLHSLGARVAINYVSSSPEADLLASELNASSPPSEPTAIAVRADVSDPDQIAHLFDQSEREFGSKVHIFVNCAGVLDPKYPALFNTPLEDFEKTFTINTRGAFLCCKEAANRVVRGGGGRIIMMSTSQVSALSPGYGVYAASKAAVEAMVKVLAKELKGKGITANCVAPGPVATDMFFAGKSDETVKRMAEACPLGRIGEPKDVAEIVGFLAGDSGEWINGQVIRANGGFVV